MLSLVPWCSLKAAEQKVELIFLVDRSGSMEGKGIQQAKRALKVRNGNPAFSFLNDTATVFLFMLVGSSLVTG
jgi:hypothetical protein